MADPLTAVSARPETWLRSPRHQRWLEAQGQRLVDFSKASRVADGFAPLDDHGQLAADAQAQTIITARMTHSYALAALQGIAGCAPLVAHGVRALAGPLRDQHHGGWFTQAPGLQPGARKVAYVHAFVALAASSAVVVGAPGAQALLNDIIGVLDQHFWSEEEGVLRESFAADWSAEEDYRGANSNMHGVEMSMALADVTGEPRWRQRALRSATRFIHEVARNNGYRVAEHFDRRWQVLRDYHHRQPADDLRPYGMTPGHFLEWSHLLLKLEASLLAHGEAAPDWLLEDAKALFASGVANGWARNGAPGILYTIDWDNQPSVENRAHWVQAEAITAAASLLKRTGDPQYEVWYRRFWDFLDLHMIDRQGGSWHNEVDANNLPAQRIYPGKADLYHAYQATLTPLVPLTPSLATLFAERNY